MRAGPLRPWCSRLWAALCVAAGLAGCSVPEPRPQPAAGIEIPAQWHTPSATEARPPAPHWWRVFGDPRLEAVVASALDANHDLAAAAARVAQAEAQARIAGAPRRPQLDAGLDASRERQNLIGFPLPPGSGGGAGGPSGGFIADARGVSLNASWEIDLWQRLRTQAEAAQADADAAHADHAAARLSLAGQAAKAYLALVASRRELALARRTLQIREATSARVRRRYEAGIAPPLDLRLAQASEAAAAAQVQGRERAVDAGRRQLETLLGDYPAGTLDSARALPPPPPVPPAAGVPAELLARRPDLVAAELRIAAAGGRVAAARAALYPQLRLTASVGRRGSEFGDLADPAFNVWRLAGSLLAPLFDGGRLRAEVDLARARLAEALQRYRQALLGALREVETALAADRFLAARVDASARQLAQAEAAAELAEQRYAAGLVDLLAVFETERQRLDAAAQALAARRERLQARVDLYLALGGGFDAS